MFEIIVLIIILLIAVAISMKRDKKKKKMLIENIGNAGYRVDVELDIPDIQKDNEPFCFIVDKTNKKWFLANYRAETAKAYDYCDIKDYKIIYRMKGNDIVKGKEFCGYCSEFMGSKTKILDMVELKSDNCEYISFEITYGGRALAEQICAKFVLFEDQYDRVSSMRHHDFILSSVCIKEAREFENILFEILNYSIENGVKNDEC